MFFSAMKLIAHAATPANLTPLYTANCILYVIYSLHSLIHSFITWGWPGKNVGLGMEDKHTLPHGNFWNLKAALPTTEFWLLISREWESTNSINRSTSLLPSYIPSNPMLTPFIQGSCWVWVGHVFEIGIYDSWLWFVYWNWFTAVNSFLGSLDLMFLSVCQSSIRFRALPNWRLNCCCWLAPLTSRYQRMEPMNSPGCKAESISSYSPSGGG